jgi:hypothetical protein
VEPDARVVREGDPGVRGPEALEAEQREQRGVERAADAAAAAPVAHVDAHVDAPSIGGAFAVTGGVGVAVDARAVHADEPWRERERGREPTRHLRRRRNVDLERDDRPGDDGRVDLGERRGVGRLGDAVVLMASLRLVGVPWNRGGDALGVTLRDVPRPRAIPLGRPGERRRGLTTFHWTHGARRFSSTQPGGKRNQHHW